MRICEVRSVLAALALVVSLAPGAGTVASAASSASPLSTMGPQAIPATVSGPGYGLFSCQLGLSVGACYDPYQMRHAYGIDTLINAGFTGKGRTIIIVDAYQSPNIVQQLNTWNTFYGLPALNGLGGASDPSLGTFTQVAPDGLTPFVTGDPNMTGWAEEISLDVLWAHAIAPGANIVLDLAKSNDDADILSATKYAVDHNLGDIISQSFGENESCVDSTLLKAAASAVRKGDFERHHALRLVGRSRRGRIHLRRQLLGQGGLLARQRPARHRRRRHRAAGSRLLPDRARL